MAFGLLFLCLLINITHSQKGQYSFEAYVSTNVFEQSSDTDDEIFFRLCAGSNCGLFMSDPAGWPNRGSSYYYDYTTPTPLGTITSVEIVHPGSDRLCLGSVKINGVEYDDGNILNAWRPWCLEDPGNGGCEKLTVTTGNDWSSSETEPCEFTWQELRETYEPTPVPTSSPTPAPTNQPTTPTISPTFAPTGPTPVPTSSPTPAPTTQPTVRPTVAPTVSPTNPSASPTRSPGYSGNVDEGDSEAPAGGGLTMTENDDDGIDYGLILGIVFGCLFCCLLIGICVYCIRNREKRQQEVNRLNIDAASIAKASNVEPERIDDASPITDGNPTTGTTTDGGGTSPWSGHASQVSEMPQLPEETFDEGGETGTRPGDDDVVPVGSPDIGDVYSGTDEHMDMYDPENAVNLENGITAGAGYDDEYEYYYEDDDGNEDNYEYEENETAGQDTNGHLNVDADIMARVQSDSVAMDQEESDENEEYEMNEMYNKARSTNKGKE